MPGTVLSTLFCMYLLILRRAYEVYAIYYPHFTDEVTWVQGHSIMKGMLRIQTRAVWLPKILIGELKEEWIA